MPPRLLPADMPAESDKYRPLHGLAVFVRSPHIEPKNIHPNLEASTNMQDLTGGDLL